MKPVKSAKASPKKATVSTSMKNVTPIKAAVAAKSVSKISGAKVASTASEVVRVQSPLSDVKPRSVKMNNMSMASVEKASASMMQAYEEINNMARAFSEASMQSAAAMTKGWEEISRTASGMMQESMARSMEASKAMMGMKDVRQAVEAQQEMVKEFCDTWMAGTGKLTEISARVSQEVVEPVATHVNTAVGKIMAKVKTAA